MKKNKLIFLVILFTIYFAVAGCRQENQIPNPDTQTDIAETPPWNASHSSMLEYYEGATIKNDKIYTYKYTKVGVNIFVYAKDTMEQIKSHEIPNVLEIKSISVNNLEQICLWGSTENGNTLWQISPNGDISIIEDIKVENLGILSNLKNFYIDSNGYYYIWYEMSVPCAEVYENGEENIYTRLDRIYVKDQQMNTIIYEEVPDSYNNKLISLVFDENGIPMLIAKDAEGYYVRRIRTSDKEKYKSKRLDISTFMSQESDSVFAYANDGLLYIWDGALYQYYLSDSRNERLFELAGVGIMEEDIIYLGMNDNTIEIIDNYKGIHQSEYTTITKGKSNKKQLTLGVMKLQPEMRKIVTSFNRYQNEVTIEPIVYVEDWDYEAGYRKLTLDVIQGKAPDLISVYGLDSENLAKAGAFTDLYMLMKEDRELNKEDLLPSVLHVYEFDEHLFTIAPTFRIYTMWGASSKFEGKSGLNVEELIHLLKTYGGDINSIYGFSADENVLTTLCALNMDKFINWSEGTCHFTGNDFQQIVDFAKEYKGKPFESLYESIQKGDILITLGMITSVEDYRLASELYGENVQFIGFPTETGNGIAAFFSGDELAISSKSEYQKEAWKFVKYFMQNGCNGTSFPMVKEQFDAYLNESMNELLTNENDESSMIAKKSYTENNIISIQIFKCEPEDVEAIRNLVNIISDKFQYHTEIQKIIDEEISSYFQEQKKLADVCKIIQSRVQLYLDEK